jgi:hypothetical protein
MEIRGEQKTALLRHVERLSQDGKLDWKEAHPTGSFKANLGTGYIYITILTYDNGQVKHSPATVGIRGETISLTGNEPELLKIAGRLAPRIPRNAADELLRELGVELTPHIREGKIRQVMDEYKPRTIFQSVKDLVRGGQPKGMKKTYNNGLVVGIVATAALYSILLLWAITSLTK